MKIKDIAQLLNAEILTPEISLETEVHTACGSDMMSDVLAYVKDQAVLVTGLNNPQVIRTADMMDMLCVVYVRGKRPDELALKIATEKHHGQSQWHEYFGDGILELHEFVVCNGFCRKNADVGHKNSQ